MNLVEKNLRKIAREVSLRWRNEGRYVIERKIFPRIKGKKVLLVGCAPYTSSYPKKLRDNELWSIDKDPEVAKDGAKNHIVGSVTEIDKYFGKESFDVILFFGIFGFGLDDIKEAEKTMKSCSKVLKNKGLMVVMWQNIFGHNQVNPRELKNFSLFRPIKFDKYPSGYETNKKQIFEFLLKD